MKQFSKRLAIVCSFLMLVPLTAAAEWVLNADESELTYLSSKMVRDSYHTIFEKNRFSRLSGSINAGEAMLKIDTASVETNVPIRNERVAEHVFQSKQYPHAVIKLDSGRDAIERMKPGMFEILEVKGTLTVRNTTKPISSKISVVRTGSHLVIQSAEPVLINALDYGLGDSFETLRDMVKLFNIPTTIPVNFSLVFSQS